MEEQQEIVEPLSLAIERHGRGDTVTVIATLGDEEVHRDKLDLNRASDRSKFGRAIHAKLPRFTPLEIDTQLLKLLADIERQREREQADAPEQSRGDELNAMELTRPELIIRRDFSGIVVPRLLGSRNGTDCVWTLYAKSGGKRSASELETSVVCGDQALHVHPMPPLPSVADVTELCRWSMESRNAWTAGKLTPTTAEVLNAVMDRIDRYVELPSDGESGCVGYNATLSLWVMLSYCYPLFPAVPYLYLAGPAGSGKTRTMDLIGRMVFRPMFSSNTTAANVFRSLHARGGTLLLDEAERLKDDRSPEVSEITSILLSGYRRGGRANRLEPSGDSFRSVSFDVYAPKLLACIRGLPPALSSRCITVRLSRASTGSPRAGRSLDDSPEDEQRIRDLLHAWMLERSATLLVTPSPASTLANRDAERWEPLFRIAALCDDAELLDFVIGHAAGQLEHEVEDATPEADPALLSALHELAGSKPRFTPGDVFESAKDIDPDAFEDGWNPRRVSAVLRRYGFRVQRSNGKRWYRLNASEVADVAKRYGYELSANSSLEGF
ncbi:hypothetical protein LF1_08810 [Rubripirellula obstinata]|uniref:DUF3631 domain-containing protein n=1 Tax=Rubripirellula obstinata TaxID=406547 RepID=A0A5B1CDT7_9BACT|nr:DUF3631 domain-containing protein [Rubripirellula obstinata]KAA1258362.1 hypothetical protein LF1_08810 [Rubripirellula obstinata]